MASERTILALNAPAGTREKPAVGVYAIVSDYWALTKPEVNLLILITTSAGYLAGPTRPAGMRILLLLRTLLGTLLVAGGTGTLNQFLERSFDSQMRRTARRPLASGRIEARHVLWFGILLSLAGVAYLALAVNLLTSFLAVITLLSYLFLYTPLKRKTPLCILVGAFPGAVPPLIGWAAARGRLDREAWLLYAVVFLWQFPHFMAIAWMYREDYSRAGYLVLPAGRMRDRFVVWQSFGVSLLLIPLSLIPAVTREAGVFCSVGALILSALFCYYSYLLAFHRSNLAARQLLAASIVYLPALFVLMMFGAR